MSWNKTDRSFKILINRRVTDAEPSKYYYNEKGDFTLDLHSLEIKMDTIPGTPPGADTSVVKVYNFAGRLTLIEDTSVPGQMTWFASSNSNTVLAQTDEASRLKDWVPDKYGSGYVIQLYDSADVQIPYSDASGWYFDYPTGILTFANANTDSGSVASRAPYKVVGYRYIGRKGTGSVSSARLSCRLATNGALPAHGAISSNVITASSNGALSVDGVTTVLGDRILVKDEGGGSHLENGIYTVTQVGDGSHPYIITRATDADSSAEVVSGIFVFIEDGTVNDNTGWMLTTNNPITLNTTALSFSQFTGAGSLVVGIGLNRSGATLAANINLDNSQASNQIRLQGGSGSNNSASAGNAGTTVTFDIKTTGSGNLLLEGKADGFELTGGATGRKLALTSGGLTFTSGNTNPNVTIPNLATSTAVVNNGGAFTQYGVLFSSVATNGVVLSTGQGATGQPLVGQGASNPVFGNVDVGSYATGILGVTHGGTGTSTSFTAGSIVFADGGGVYAQDNANLFWDDTNNTLGVGTTRSGAISGTNPSLRIKGNGNTSSTSSFEVQDSGANTLMFVRNDGWVGIGTNNPTSHFHLLHTHASDASFTLHTDALTITSSETARDIKTLLVGMTINAGANTLSPSGSAYMPNQWNQLTISSGQSGAITIPLYGLNNEIVYNATSATTHTSITGIRNLWNIGSGADGTITTSNAFMSRIISGTASTTTITALTHFNTGYTLSGNPTFTTLTGIDINDPGAGTVTTQYGVRIRDLSRASTNYGIYFDGTSGLARQGVWWNADTNIYRSSAHVLTTDDNILLASVDKEIRLSSSNSNVGGVVWNTNWRLSSSSAVGFNFTQPSSTAVGGSVYGALLNRTLSAVVNSAATLYGAELDSIVTDVDAPGAIVYSGDSHGLLITSQYQTYHAGGSLANLYGAQIIGSFYDDLSGSGGTLANQFGISVSTDESGSGAKVTNSTTIYLFQNSVYTANSQTRYGLYIDTMPSPGVFTGTITAAIYLAGTGGARDGIVFGSDTNIYRSAANTLKTDDSLIVGTNLSILNAGTFSLYESGSVNFSSFVAGTQAADIRYTLPTVQPAVNQSLKATSVSGSGPYDVTLSWATPSGGVDWTDVTGTSQTAAAGNGYLANNAGLVTFTLPAPAVGSIIEIVGVGAGGWTANCASGHTVRLGTVVSASTGAVSSTNRYDSLKLLGVSTTQWQIIHSVGTLDIV